MPLETLGASLNSAFSGKPGKQMSALISKLISSKMPGGFNQGAMRKRMEETWGLGSQRQTSIICFAVTLEPSSRLQNSKAGEEWLDGVVSKYGSYSGVTLTPDQQSSTNQSRTIDAASLAIASKEQKGYLEKQFRLLAKHLEIDHKVGKKETTELLSALETARDKLRRWDNEFDDDFYSGIKPIFDPAKIRTFDSWWNWARQDLIASALDSKLSSENLGNRWDSSCEEIRSFWGLRVKPSPGECQHRLSKYCFAVTSHAPSTTVSATGKITYSESPRKTSYSNIVKNGRHAPGTQKRIPFVHLRSRTFDGWSHDTGLTDTLMEVLATGAHAGLSFAGKTALVTGAGPQSIGAEIVRGLLEGGARVIVTTSREPSAGAEAYQTMYRQHGANGSSLDLVPCNQASKKDCDDLISYIYSDRSGFDDLDFILPFGAIPQNGQLDSLGGKSELAHRAMLVNILRLLGSVKKYKELQRAHNRPTNVLLPLSPNHGTFGGDGLYGESKIGLETLLNRGESEDWHKILPTMGVVIGWTRGTGLMSANNMVAGAIEENNVMTFSQEEMAFNILSLLTPEIAGMAEDEPIIADLNGGLQFVSNLKAQISSARAGIAEESRIHKALVAEQTREQQTLNGPGTPPRSSSISMPRGRRALLNLGFPELPEYTSVTRGLPDLEGMLDLDQVVVVVGYSELSPWGSTRSRWDMESTNTLTTESYIEMAWMMGLVKHFEGNLSGEAYAGWIDAQTKEPVHDSDFQQRYGKTIMNHSGLRFIEPEGLGGYDPSRKELLHEVVVEEDLPPFEASKASATALTRRHGDLAIAEPVSGSEQEYMVQIKRGAHFLVPKAIESDRFVAGQLPRGFNPARWGIPFDIVSQVDPVVIYALCCVSEAVLKAGLEDPAELYQHIHVSELINCLGTGAGSLLAMRKIYRERYLDREVQNDILQESYLNAIGAWTNMLLLASSGPIKTPTGTCATAIESLDGGCEAIKSGKAKVAFVGGSDDFQDEMSYEFGNMKATCNTRDELAKGRLPSEMSRPTSSSRSGFVESAGCGVQILTSASFALETGLPIYGIVSLTQLAGDKIGRSVPAPGQGILTAAREAEHVVHSPLLDLEFRKQQLQNQFQGIAQWRKSQMAELYYLGVRIEDRSVQSIDAAAEASYKSAQALWANDLRKQEPDMSPMRASLATWGLGIDDLQAASFHGTSTTANDMNESNVINTQMQHLGRSSGNPLLVVCQKHLTGHTKGAAGGLMLNGALQTLQTGIVPGNRNADNIDKNLRQFEHLVYPNTSINTAGIKAVMLTSFGFGQKGAITILVSPRYLFSAISKDAYTAYASQVKRRCARADQAFAKGIMTNSLFKAKDHSPWEKAGETRVFLDPKARLRAGEEPGVPLSFDPKNLHGSAKKTTANLGGDIKSHDNGIGMAENALKLLQSGADTGKDTTGVGVDTEHVANIPVDNEAFLTRNYTVKEREHCGNAADERASLAGRWTAKEAVFKSLRTKSKGGGAAMREIEILNEHDGSPKVVVSTSTSSRPLHRFLCL